MKRVLQKVACAVVPLLLLTPGAVASSPTQTTDMEVMSRGFGDLPPHVVEKVIAQRMEDEGQSRKDATKDLVAIARENISVQEEKLSPVSALKTSDSIPDLADPRELEIVERARARAILEPQEVEPRSSIEISTKRGDIGFVSSWDMNALFTGHVSMFTNSGNRIVHIPDGFSRVQRDDRGKGTRRLHVRARNQNRRDHAAWWAESEIGKKYNWSLDNRRIFSNTVNCSQLVWASYMWSQGLDIDIDEGKSVWPRDMYKSNYTREF